MARSTVRRVLLAGCVGKTRGRRRATRYPHRERYPKEWILLQTNGSRHDCLVGRGPSLTLVGAVDGATGTVPFALFRKQEDLRGHLPLLREIISRHGVPAALYSDQNRVFQRSPSEPDSLAERLGGRRRPTQFARALVELDLGLILAHTPQAKGRVRRTYGTLYDRPVSKMRLAWTAANRILRDFLQGYNQRAWNRPSRDRPIASSRRGSSSRTPSASSFGGP